MRYQSRGQVIEREWQDGRASVRVYFRSGEEVPGNRMVTVTWDCCDGKNGQYCNECGASLTGNKKKEACSTCESWTGLVHTNRVKGYCSYRGKITGGGGLCGNWPGT